MRNRKKLAKKYIVRNVLLLVFSLLFLVAGMGCFYVDGLVQNFTFTGNLTPIVSQAINASTVDSGTTFTTNGANQVNGLLKDEAITNLLLIGVDDYQEDDPIGRSDSMMLISLDNRHQKIKMTSFMRDTYVAIPGHTSQKLNAAYRFGAYYSVEDDGAQPGDLKSVDAGAQLCMQTIQLHFGMYIDRYIVVKDSAFNEVIDALGGVDVDLTAKEARQIDISVDDSYLEDTQTSSVTTQHLNGAQAHYYSRIRQDNIPNINGNIGDVGRAERQRLVVQAIIDKFKSSDLGTISRIAEEVLPNVITNMSADEVVSMLLQAMTILQYPTESYQVPAEGDYTTPTVSINGAAASIVQINDLVQTREKVLDFIYESDRPETTSDVTEQIEELGRSEQPAGTDYGDGYDDYGTDDSGYDTGDYGYGGDYGYDTGYDTNW